MGQTIITVRLDFTKSVFEVYSIDEKEQIAHRCTLRRSRMLHSFKTSRLA